MLRTLQNQVWKVCTEPKSSSRPNCPRPGTQNPRAQKLTAAVDLSNWKEEVNWHFGHYFWDFVVITCNIDFHLDMAATVDITEQNQIKVKENRLVGFINQTDKVVNFFSERHLKSRVEVKLFIFCFKFLHVRRLLDQTIMCQWTGLGTGLDVLGRRRSPCIGRATPTCSKG